MDLLVREIFPDYFGISHFGALARTCKRANYAFLANMSEICLKIARRGAPAQIRAMVRALVWAQKTVIIDYIIGALLPEIRATISIDAIEFGHNIIAIAYRQYANSFDFQIMCVLARNMKLFGEIQGRDDGAQSRYVAQKYPLFRNIIPYLYVNYAELLVEAAARSGVVEINFNVNFNIENIFEVACESGNHLFARTLIERRSQYHLADSELILAAAARTKNIDLFRAVAASLEATPEIIFLESIGLGDTAFAIKMCINFSKQPFNAVSFDVLYIYKEAIFRAFAARNLELVQYFINKITKRFDVKKYSGPETLGPAIIEECIQQYININDLKAIGHSCDEILIRHTMYLWNSTFNNDTLFQYLLEKWDGESYQELLTEYDYGNNLLRRWVNLRKFAKFVKINKKWHNVDVYREMFRMNDLNILHEFMKFYDKDILGPEINNLTEGACYNARKNSFIVLSYLGGKCDCGREEHCIVD